MAGRRAIVVADEGDIEDYARRIILEVTEKGETLLTATGRSICKLFDSINRARETLQTSGLDIRVGIEKIGVVMKDEEKIPYVLVKVEAVEGSAGGGEPRS
ncbi:MAG: hypothetical protein F7B17_07200 [Desulfurococcales archaeon]|nr:hypothetical protein [Desulfurococcales archaeon]